MSLVQRFGESARRLTGHFGHESTLTLKRIAGGALGADRSVTPVVTSATVNCSRPQPYGASLRDGSRVQDGDLRVHVWGDDPGLTYAPQPDMVAELDGDSYRIVSVQRLVGAYELQLRGGGA